MRTRADIIVYSPNGQAQLAVEVTRIKDAGDDWAAEFRRNLMADNLLPNMTFFLMVLPEHFYLWLPEAPAGQDLANYKAKTKDVLGRFGRGDELEDIREAGLASMVSFWLNIMTVAKVSRESAPELDWVFDSGLYERIKNGSVSAECEW